MALPDSIRQGKLDDALSELEEQVRQAPADPQRRESLFQLLAVRGDWKRAEKQLEVLRDLDPQTLLMVHGFRAAVRAEAVRAEVFAGRQTPPVIGEPEPWLALLFEALRQLAEGNTAAAVELRTKAFEQAEAQAGTIRTSHSRDEARRFEWIADADSRLGPVFEAVVNGEYHWVPFSRVRSITIDEPTNVVDCVWTLARIVWVNQGNLAALIPTRYPGSEQQTDPMLSLSRKTEWTQLADGCEVGRGQRLWATDSEDYPIMDVRELVFDSH